ncbi:hypothetical protein HYPSUDRAFT_48863 [Hypholoma sublateritium FD-334 SS-4]|uniref:Uncharacterized protein n=1 Tax=Hypholoma sublateritium (strain FD-334 SS-4) TaxID=945553 RepID=A0A0D2LVD8_HYPSF|nr:hypothetical protein HYPSUDRAFT_48863 [Hypholoma sublateritium FD-334 SS-4]
MTEITTILRSPVSQTGSQELPTPPSTPRRPHEIQDSRSSPRRTEHSRNGGYGGSVCIINSGILKERSVHTGIHQAFVPSTRLTRASKRTFSERGRDGQDMGMVELIFPSSRRKPRKRVRFSEIEGLPVSDIRTPPEDLLPSSDSDELVLPKPSTVASPSQRKTAGGSSQSAPTEVQNFKMYIRLPRRNERTGLKAQFGEDVSPKNMVNHSRTKTRWDPTSGKRIPVALPDASQSSLKQGSVAGDESISEDYEQNLSEGLCNTSLG